MSKPEEVYDSLQPSLAGMRKRIRILTPLAKTLAPLTRPDA
jgi:hypothetical protein